MRRVLQAIRDLLSWEHAERYQLPADIDPWGHIRDSGDVMRAIEWDQSMSEIRGRT